MSSWLVSLGCIDGAALGRGRWLQEYSLRSPGVADDLCCVGPGRRVAETAAQIIEQGRDLAVAHAVGKAGHDRAALGGGGTNAGQYYVGGVARVGAGEGGRERQVDFAE